MSTIRAYGTDGPREALKPMTIERREPGPQDVLIEIKHCGICHSDIHQARDEWGGSIFPMVPGHEIAGLVTEVGSKVSKFKVGDRVGVGCMVDSCRKCDSCKEGLEQHCARMANYTYNGYEIDGKTPTYGGYSQKLVVNEDFVLRIPDNLPLAAAAPLLCAGITTYSPLRHWQAGPGKTVAVVGLGGLGHMAVKLAKAMGARVTVLSQSLKKKDDGIKFGASDYFATSDAETFRTLASSFDLLINTVSSDMDWNLYLNLLKRDGSMVLLGVPPVAPPVKAFSLIAQRRSLSGSLIGGIAETQDMLDFCGKNNIVCDIEQIRADQINEAYERMLRSDVRYRFVIDCATF
jgi:alcohol dehydrogenase (NADP+)